MVHEALVDLFRARPHLAAELLALARAIHTGHGVRGVLLDSDLSQVVGPEYRADAAVRLTGDDLDLLLIIEIQLREDVDKTYAWPAYAAVARARHRCPTAVLVLTLDAATARWASRPISLGPGAELRPIVIGPEQVPVVTDPETARESPEIAVLSAMVHGRAPEGARVGLAAAEAARDLDEARARLYLDLVLSSLNPAARTMLERVMIENWQPQSDFIKRLDARAHAEGLAEGLAEGQRELLIRMLHRRFGALPETVTRRVAHASSSELGQWSEDLLFADSLAALFGAEAEP